MSCTGISSKFRIVTGVFSEVLDVLAFPTAAGAGAGAGVETATGDITPTAPRSGTGTGADSSGLSL